MSSTTSSPGEMKVSNYADVADIGFGLNAQTSIAKVVSDEVRARSWRVTLAPLRRKDNAAVNAAGGAGAASRIFNGATQQYAAGQDNQPQVPPRRVNPMFGLNQPSNGADIEPLYVQLVWGMSSGQRCTLIAHWPSQGASITVEGCYVEVFVASFCGAGAGFPVLPGELPTVAAHITPTEGLASEAQGELSLTQNVQVRPFVGAGTIAGFYTDGIAFPTMGFQVGAGEGVGAPPRGAMVASTVYNVAPFVSYDGILTFGPGPANTTTKLVIFTSNVGGPVFTLADNATPDGGGGFGAEFGTVGINYITDGVTGVKTVADLETLIATSALVKIAKFDTPHAALKLFAGFTKLGTHVPNTPGPLWGTSLTIAPTQGCAVFVPDFARRVKVEVADIQPAFLGNEYRVPLNGPYPAQLVWYDDFGRVVYTEFQGRTISANTSGLDGPTEPNAWRPVPATAVMLAVYSASNAQAFFHWRITP